MLFCYMEYIKEYDFFHIARKKDALFCYTKDICEYLFSSILAFSISAVHGLIIADDSLW